MRSRTQGCDDAPNYTERDRDHKASYGQGLIIDDGKEGLKDTDVPQFHGRFRRLLPPKDPSSDKGEGACALLGIGDA